MNPKQGNDILSLPINLLGIFAHEDDELVGAGGTLIKNVKLGGSSHIICFGGSTRLRSKEFKNACRVMGVTCELLNLKEGHYDRNKLKITTKLRNEIIKHKPEFVITHRKQGDYHPDHKIVSDLAREASIRAQTPLNGWLIKGLLYTEGHSLHSVFHVMVDVSKYSQIILKAFHCHKSQIKKNQGYYLATLDERTKLRGVQAGCERAEAFFYEPLPLVGSFNRRNLGV